METLVSARLEGHRSMNPCPVYDEVLGKLILFFIAVPGKISEQHQLKTKTNLVRLCYVTSMDQGRTWSAAHDVTDSTIRNEYKNWATFAVGPGHGLQLLNRARSLVIPAYAYRILDPKKHPTPHAFCFISSDHGTTWEMGNFVGEESAVECQVAEVHTCGRKVLYCNARSNRGARIQAVSYNHGLDFEGGQRVERLTEPPSGCHGSITAFPPPSNARCQDSWLLYTHPTDTKDRKDLGIYLNKSPLNPAHWTKPTILFKGLCAYSDLQYMGIGPDGSPLFSCLFEYGTHRQCEEMIFVMFTLKQAFPSEHWISSLSISIPLKTIFADTFYCHFSSLIKGLFLLLLHTGVKSLVLACVCRLSSPLNTPQLNMFGFVFYCLFSLFAFFFGCLFTHHMPKTSVTFVRPWGLW